MCPAGDFQEERAATETHTDRRALLKLALAAAAGAVSALAASGATAKATDETEGERKRNIGRFLNTQTARKTQLPARMRKQRRRHHA